MGPPRGRSPPSGRASRARFTVSVSGAAAITPAASGRESELGDQLVDQRGRDERPGRVVDGHQFCFDPIETRGDGLRAMLTAGDHHHSLAQFSVVTRR